MSVSSQPVHDAVGDGRLADYVMPLGNRKLRGDDHNQLPIAVLKDLQQGDAGSAVKVAEAAKVIENSQRDINIAFVNELARIFNRMGIDTLDVLEAASTKWNFLPFKPGLVGGHCIGVDPYYLAQKAQEVGYHPEIILAGRRLNDGMGAYVASEVVKLLINRSSCVKGSRVLVLGITFKENCPDIRNSQLHLSPFFRTSPLPTRGVTRRAGMCFNATMALQSMLKENPLLQDQHLGISWSGQGIWF